jgi:arginyl-tRNA synthetase
VKDQIKDIVKSVCRDLFHIETEVELTRPESQFGDYSTNIALKLSKQLSKSPKEIAEMIAGIMNNQSSQIIEKVSVEGPGFINLLLTQAALHKSYSKASDLPKSKKDELILVEFGDPNPFKEMHLGHIYSSIEGDTIANLLQSGGAEVKRLSYHGDVGLQVAKFIYGIGEFIDWKTDRLSSALKEKSLGFYYSSGAKAYENDEAIANRIKEINDHIYKKDNETINYIYEKGLEISFNQFADILKQIQVKYDKRYLESESSKAGLKTVRENIGRVFEESEGAVVYKGEKVGLHTRVFINSRGLPTYETKELGLVELKHKDYPDATKSIIITANEQIEYFKVVLAALSEIDPKLASITTHLAHGFLSLTTGKMSSRTGDVYAAKTLLDDIRAEIRQHYPNSDVQDDIFLSSIRYTFLKQRLGADIIFDVKESVSLEGNSGPYIQYAHARARSILQKADGTKTAMPGLKIEEVPLEQSERFLAMKISQFPEIVERATNDYMPHHICTYLYELAQEFNSFYESNRVIGDSRMFTRLHLVNVYADILENGLKLLNIPAPVHM